MGEGTLIRTIVLDFRSLSAHPPESSATPEISGLVLYNECNMKAMVRRFIFLLMGVVFWIPGP